MARKLKIFATNLGFFELAIAAPSMKAALEAWGMRGDAFKNGFAKETDDAKVVTAAMAKPGIVLKRPVGTKGAFKEDADLPTVSSVLSKSSAPMAKPLRRKVETRKPKRLTRKDDGSDRAALVSFEKAKAARDRKTQAEEARQETQREKDQARIARALAKAQAALDEAKARHDAALADVERDRDRLDRRAKLEKERWEKERGKLEEALDRVGQ